jgi:flagellar motor switch protein FliN/FliY
MTEDKPAPSQDPILTELEWLVAEWMNRLAHAIAALGGQQPGIEKTDKGDPPREAGSFWWAQGFTLMAGHAICIGAPESAWKALGGTALGAAGIHAPEPADMRETYREILVQSLAGLAQSLTARLKTEVTCEPGESLAAPPESETYAFINVRAGDDPPAPLCLMASPAFLEQLASATPAEAPSAAPRSADPEESGGLRSLFDLEMPISISFGKVSVPLQEAMELRSGSLVPLNRAPDDPVELRVNERVVARGQIVMIDGNYAIRIVELLSRGERLRHAGSVQRGGASLHPGTH